MPFRFFYIIALCLFIHPLFSQQFTGKGKLTGILVTSGNDESMPFATISIYTQKDSLVEGSLSDENGKFNITLSFGSYYALVEFMGYGNYKSDLFVISKDNLTKDLGKISMSIQANTLDEIVVQGEKTVMQLSLDKRIFNVGKDLANAGGSASDILLNLPSIAVDPEGNVRLRGSANVRILIDGKPSGLVSFKGSSGLRQLPANMV